MAAKRVSRALSPYAKAQRKAMRAAGIKPDPKPKFKIGNRVRVTDTSVVGTVTFIGSYDAYIGQYRYKIKDDDARGGQKYWNEDSLVKTSRKVENPSRKPIDHKFAGALFSAGHSKTALAYLRGTLTKSTARELAAGKKRR